MPGYAWKHPSLRPAHLALLFGGACTIAAAAPGAAIQGVQADLRTPQGGSGDTAGNDDPLYQQPFIDIDEMRPSPVPHRYIHGGFRGTEARFSLYLPAKEKYKGRFFQYITPFPMSENLSQQDPAGQFNKIGFAVDSGAYLLETNGGGAFDLARGKKGSSDPTIAAYRANAAAAQYSRIIARRVFATSKRAYGYAFGGSGGAYRTIGAIENTSGVWDGVVPYVAGSGMALPNVFTVRLRAMRILRDKFPEIVDAMEPGGSGDPYAGLDPEQAAALREVTRMGFPLRSWFGYRTMGMHGFIAIYSGMLALDPSYFTDFWTKKGYEGASPPPSMVRDRLQFASTIAGPLTEAEAERLGLKPAVKNVGVDTAFHAGAPPAGFKLSDTAPPIYFQGGDLIVRSGAAAGQRIMLVKVSGNNVVTGIANPEVLAKVKPGDSVEIDNSNFLAVETYQRHQVPGPDYKVWDQYRDASGAPLYPQRPLLGPIFMKGVAGSLQTGKFQGKMIIVESLLDREAFAWQADWYRELARKNLGDRTDANMRIYMNDHTLHGDEPDLEDPSRTVTYIGMVQQALRDISDWAEHGIAPPGSTDYRIVDGQIHVPASAAARKGLQPVVMLTANGAPRAEVRSSGTITLTATADVPPGGGRIVSAEWDPEGTGTYPVKVQIAPGQKRIRISMTYRYTKPGTYFPGIRVNAQRQGDGSTPYARLPNLGRARVVVR